MNTARNLLLVCFAFGCVPSAGVAETILFESGTLGPTGIPISELLNQNVPGTNINSAVFAGVRFQLDQPAITSQVGGHFVANGGGTFFGAIVALDDANDFPDSGDLMSDDVLGHAELTFPTLSDEVIADLDLTLQPGFYALVFGSGLFGTDGSGVAVRNGIDIGSPSYVFMGPNFGWFNATIASNHRFVVKGQVVSEPSAIAILAVGAMYFLRPRRE